MIQAVEAMVDQEGRVRLLAPVHVSARCRALVTILDESPSGAGETALLSEASLAEDWSHPEEEAAWSYLASGK
ncbi:MAG: hypothetical protein ABSG86_09575 [Thermoguttaceae bacterium]